MSIAKVVWCDSPPGESAVSGSAELRTELLRLHADQTGVPLLATVACHGLEIGVGLGAPESVVFVHRERDDGARDEWVTIGERAATGVVDFLLHSNHHTQVERKHLVPAATAIEIVMALVRMGSRPAGVEWQHSLV